MEQQSIGVLHPGSMGAAVAAQAVAAGADVRWLPEGRGEATRRRARDAGLRPIADPAAMARECGVILSVCPPAAALDVAQQLADVGFDGLYVEANAISPEQSRTISHLLGAAGASVVDGGIIGPPPRRPGTTRLYLSGPAGAVAVVRAVFEGTALTVMPLDGPVGRASALKLSFASYSKISHALAAQACALAAGHDVLDDLLELAADALPDTVLATADRLPGAAARAWRWAPEMREIARACAEVGVSPDVALTAAAVFDRWSGHKDDPGVDIATLLSDLTTTSARPADAAAF
jgi:3-hydroxyisobutyrate dehydrogenase-like beta-hydroxyacid dehydrogenase